MRWVIYVNHHPTDLFVHQHQDSHVNTMFDGCTSFLSPVFKTNYFLPSKNVMKNKRIQCGKKKFNMDPKKVHSEKYCRLNKKKRNS